MNQTATSVWATGGMRADESGQIESRRGRLRSARQGRRLSVEDAAAMVRTCAAGPVPANLADRWVEWERGRSEPGSELQVAVATAFGVVPDQLFGPGPERRGGTDAGDDRVIRQLLDAYPTRPAEELAAEAAEHLAMLSVAHATPVPRDPALLHLLLAHLHHDLGERPTSTIHQRLASGIATRLADRALLARCRDLAAACAVTSGRSRTAIEIAQDGGAATTTSSLGSRMRGHEARAWARLGQHRAALMALDRARELLSAPQDPDDPWPDDGTRRFEADAMEVYRVLGDDLAAESFAAALLAGDAPMAAAPAHLTLGVTAARRGDAGRALHAGYQGLAVSRRCRPAVALVVEELLNVLDTRWPRHSEIARLRSAAGLRPAGRRTRTAQRHTRPIRTPARSGHRPDQDTGPIRTPARSGHRGRRGGDALVGRAQHHQ